MVVCICEAPKKNGPLSLLHGYSLAMLYVTASAWLLLPHQIFARDVHFWDNLPHELELMHHQKMYPPRFTLQVYGDKAIHDATALVEFEGACEDLSTEIHLGLPTNGMHILYYVCVYSTFTPLPIGDL